MLADTPLEPASGSAAETPSVTPESMADALLFNLDGERFRAPQATTSSVVLACQMVRAPSPSIHGGPLRWHGLMQAAVEAFGGSVTLDPAA